MLLKREEPARRQPNSNKASDQAKPPAIENPFSNGCSILVVREVAEKWRVSEQHVIDLLEEGKLNGFDISGRHDYMRVPTAAIDAICQTFRLQRETVLKIITEAKPKRITSRAHWRIPVKEGFEAFIAENYSTVLAR